MRKDQKHTGPPEYPEAAEGPEAFARFRELTRRLARVPKEKLRDDTDRSQPPS